MIFKILIFVTSSLLVLCIWYNQIGPSGIDAMHVIAIILLICLILEIALVELINTRLERKSMSKFTIADVHNSNEKVQKAYAKGLENSKLIFSEIDKKEEIRSFKKINKIRDNSFYGWLSFKEIEKIEKLLDKEKGNENIIAIIKSIKLDHNGPTIMLKYDRTHKVIDTDNAINRKLDM